MGVGGWGLFLVHCLPFELFPTRPLTLPLGGKDSTHSYVIVWESATWSMQLLIFLIWLFRGQPETVVFSSQEAITFLEKQVSATCHVPQPLGFHSWCTIVHEFLSEGQLSSTRFSQFIYMGSFQRVSCQPRGFHSWCTWVIVRGSAVSHVVFTADVFGLLSEGQLSATWFSQLIYMGSYQRISCQPRGFHSWWTWAISAVSHVVFTADVQGLLSEGQLSATWFSQLIYMGYCQRVRW